MSIRTNRKIRLTPSVFILSMLLTAAGAKTIYVDDDAAGANNGSSWADAYTFLQEGLADANLSEKPVEIRVAQGIYRPNGGLVAIPEFNWRTTTFQLINGVTLRGGYAGLGKADPNERDIHAYETILSGDLNADDSHVLELLDLLYEPTRAENSYHVVTAIHADDTLVLDGFTITAGNANAPESADSNSYGAGLYNYQSNSIVIDCVFIGNSARWTGAGMYNRGSSPALANCTFSKNSAGTRTGGHGGGMDSAGGNPILTTCNFSSNWAGQGGGINALGSAPIARSCTFTDNSANFGGAVQYKDCPGPEFSGCTFSGNSAFIGAASRFIKSSPILTNCLFAGNSADDYGGAIAFTNMSISTLANCTFAANSGAQGGALGCDHALYGPSDIHITNSIFWNGGKEIWNEDGSTIDISYSNIHSRRAGVFDPCDAVIWGEGNTFQYPLFADPNNGDYHLKSQAGRWDPISESWVRDDVSSPCIDAGDPNSPVGDEPQPNGGRINMGAYGGTKEASMSPVAETVVYIQWLGHSSVKLWAEDCIVYVDPQRLSISPHDATLVLVTHSHGDHYSSSDIARVANAQTQFIAPPDVVQQHGSGQTITPGQIIESYCARLTAVAAYNTNKTNHPKSRNWVGYVIELGGKRIYVAGDTDLIDEMKSLGDIDAAILPAGGTYTMTAVEAAEAIQYIKPDLAIPYHWGRNVGTLADAQTFAQLARCAVKIMTAGETIGSDNWPAYSPLLAHWKLDETAGNVADDSADGYDGVLYGNPAWQPVGGKTGGALQLDGVDDYAGTPFVSNPYEGPFSVYAWVKSGAAGGVIISQADGAGAGATWLGADPVQGRLTTALVPPAAGRLSPQPLVSGFVITDGQWHHVGLVWDGALRHLYADGAEVAKDTGALAALQSCDGGLHLGAGKGLDGGTFWAGLLDDVRIYNVALSPAELEQIAR
jgi:predicted outer membrane repeat protein